MVVSDPTEHPEDQTTGSGLVAEKARRLARVGELRERGDEPYPYRFDRSHTLGELRRAWGELEPGTETEHEVTVAGRVMLNRDTGKLVFATVQDRSDQIQLFISKAVTGDDHFADVKELDLGDWVGVHGTVMTTRKGELSVQGRDRAAAVEGDAPAARTSGTA